MHATIYHRETGEILTLPSLVGTAHVKGGEWTFEEPAPEDWELEAPRYRLTVSLKAPTFDRMRHDPPWSQHFEAGVNVNDPDRVETWQYCEPERVYRKGEEITSLAWPHNTMVPLNFSAKRVKKFFSDAIKSRLPISPWYRDRVRLDDGMSFKPLQLERGRDD